MSKDYILVSDIGGTNSRFGVFSCPNSKLELVFYSYYSTAEAKDIYSLLQDFLDSIPNKDIKNNLKIAVISAAGPVIDNICSPPNISWNIHLSKIKKFLQIEQVFLINDFISQSYSIFHSETKCLEVKNASISLNSIRDFSFDKDRINCCFIGPGTGLGKACLIINKDGNIIELPSEGGHVSYPIETKEDFLVSNFIKDKLKIPFVSLEHLLSGNGIININLALNAELLNIDEISKKMEQGMLSNVSEFYIKAFSKVCRNFSLEFIADCIFICGGVISKNSYLLKDSLFLEEFHKGSDKINNSILKNISIFHNISEESGLYGAAIYGLNKLKKLDTI